MRNQNVANMILRKSKGWISKLKAVGFYHIFLSSVLVKVAGLTGNIILARVMSKTDYGTYSYILNAYAILSLLADMGTNVAAVQMCSEFYNDSQKQDAAFLWLFRLGMGCILFSCASILASTIYYPYKSHELGIYTTLLFFLPVLENVNRFLLSNARSKLKDQIYARINIFSSLIHWVFLLPMAYAWSFKGAVYSGYLIQFAIMLYSLQQSRGFLNLKVSTANLTCTWKKITLKMAFSSGLSNLINNSLGLVDVFFLGLVLQDMNVIASYKVAANIPAAMAFIPSTIDTVLLPRFARMNSEPKQVFSAYCKVITAICGVNVVICAGTFLLGSKIMAFLYGAQYVDAAQCFSILIVGYFFSCIRSVSYGVLYSQRRVGINLFVVAFSAVLTVVLNMTLIPAHGSIGAAWASAFVNFLAALIMVSYLVLHLLKRARADNIVS